MGLSNHACMASVLHMRISPKPQALNAACKQLDCSRDELARRMGVATATAYRIDAGRTEPSPKFIASLMDVTGLKFEDLFDIVRDAA